MIDKEYAADTLNTSTDSSQLAPSSGASDRLRALEQQDPDLSILLALIVTEFADRRLSSPA